MSRLASSVEPDRPEDALSAEILDAVVAIVALEGFEGATIRRVAAQAGCSAGALQKRFATRSRLLRAAFELVVETSLARITDSTFIEAVEGTETATLAQSHYLAALETLPLDETRRREGLVWTSYLLRAAVEDSLSDLPRRLDQVVHEALTEELTYAQVSGALQSKTDPRLLADALIALVDGIAIRMLYTPESEHDALLTALDTGLHALLPSPQTPSE